MRTKFVILAASVALSFPSVAEARTKPECYLLNMLRGDCTYQGDGGREKSRDKPTPSKPDRGGPCGAFIPQEGDVLAMGGEGPGGKPEKPGGGKPDKPGDKPSKPERPDRPDKPRPEKPTPSNPCG
jgi:hypothetical protein